MLNLLYTKICLFRLLQYITERSKYKDRWVGALKSTTIKGLLIVFNRGVGALKRTTIKGLLIVLISVDSKARCKVIIS